MTSQYMYTAFSIELQGFYRKLTELGADIELGHWVS